MKRPYPFIPVYLFAVLLLIGTVSQARADTLTIQDAVQRALQNHPAIQRAMEDAKAAEARVGQSRSALYPTVDGLASYTRIGPAPEMPVGNSTFKLAPENNYDVHAGAHYNLFDFGKIEAQVTLSQRRATTAADAIEAARSTLAYQAMRAFYGTLFLEQSIGVQDQEIAALNGHLDVARKRVQTGVATNLDVLTTEVRVATAQSQRVDLQSNLDKQKALLRELTGLPPTTPLDVRGEFRREPVVLAEDSLIAAAYRQRTEMQVARDTENIARVQQRLASLADLPAIGAFAAAGFKNGYPPNLDKMMGNWAAGAELTVPFYSGKRKEFQKQEANATLRSAEANRKNLERQIQSETDRAIVDVKAAQSKLEISEVAIQRATAAVAVARSAYSYGTITNVDLLDAETSLAQADLIQLQALYGLELSRFTLEQVTGAKVWEGPR